MGIYFKPCLSIFCSEAVKQVLIATLDSIRLLLCVKWTISDELLPLKYDLVLPETVPVNNCTSQKYWYFFLNYFFFFFLPPSCIKLGLVFCIPFNPVPFSASETIIYGVWQMWLISPNWLITLTENYLIKYQFV